MYTFLVSLFIKILFDMLVFSFRRSQSLSLVIKRFKLSKLQKLCPFQETYYRKIFLPTIFVVNGLKRTLYLSAKSTIENVHQQIFHHFRSTYNGTLFLPNVIRWHSQYSNEIRAQGAILRLQEFVGAISYQYFSIIRCLLL